MTRPFPFVLGVLAFLLSSTAPPAHGTLAGGPDDADLLSLVRVFRGSGEEIDLPRLLDALSRVEAVFLGETHVDETTHLLEWHVYEHLVATRDGKVVLALEMFDREAQPALDDYLAGRIAESDFLARSRPWSNYATGYRPLIELAKTRQLPVVASNAPRAVLRKASAGKEAFAALTETEKSLVAAELYPNSEHYWQRFFRTTRSHGGGGPRSPTDLLYSIQSLWDNTMGESCAQALERHPGTMVLHVNGGFHSAYHDGTVLQLKKRRPETTIATVAIDPVRALPVATVEGAWERGVADYVVLTHQRARDILDGAYAVPTEIELPYLLWMPPSATPQQPVALLIWLTGEGTRPQDMLELLKLSVGERVAIAVVEGLHTQQEEDLHLGHRWFWTESFDRFAKDLGAAQAAVLRIAGYLGRRFPITSGRVVVAGEGQGATVVTAACLARTPMRWRGVAFAPRSFRSLRFLELPESNPTFEGLQLLAAEQDRTWWEDETSQYRQSGLQVSLSPVDESSFASLEAALHEALAMPPAAAAKDDGRPILLVALVDTPLARSWRRWHARLLARTGARVREVTLPDLDAVLESPGWEQAEVRALAVDGEELGGPLRDAPQATWGPRDFADGRGLPLAPGSFGGTTVVHVPRADEKQRAAWLELEAGDVLRKRSPFASLRIAFSDGERTLPAVLEDLRTKGRRQVLIVPATFSATPEMMRALAEQTRPFANDLDIAWLPGLGGELAELVGGSGH